ncbi:YjfB family protein [Scandinavium sp.]|uniref:YjfB family protein n=1 Tax=Scandinavium sp. TaxID=2830653 RepID=UPI002899EA5D|nr:YjfB family protein [Scandinavium sp.]
MDISQIESMSTAMDQMQFRSEVGTLVMKKSLDAQSEAATAIIQSIPQLPANPAIGRNINVTA